VRIFVRERSTPSTVSPNHDNKLWFTDYFVIIVPGQNNAPGQLALSKFLIESQRKKSVKIMTDNSH
jgi:hypothetical protein